MARIWDWMKTIRYTDEIIGLAFEEGPQVIDYGQGVAAVILTLDEYQRITGEVIDLSQKTIESPWEMLRKKREEQASNSMLNQINESNKPEGSAWPDEPGELPRPNLFNGQIETNPEADVSKERTPGLFAGQIEMSEDFDAPIELVDSEPDEKPVSRPATGLYEGKIEIRPDFDDPLDEFE